MSTDPIRQSEPVESHAFRLPRLRGRARILAGAAAIAVLSFTAGGLTFAQRGDSAAPSRMLEVAAATAEMPVPIPIAAAVPDQTPRLLEQGAPFSFANLVEAVSPAVVTVLVEREQQPGFQIPDNIPEPFRDFFRQFGGEPDQDAQPRRAQAMGSGFFIESGGYLVTNNHVIDGSTKISVKLPDSREFDARVIGTDASTDIALLKVDGTGFPTVAFGDDRRLRVGDWVVAVGNPFGLGGTVTAGIVSSIGRDIGNGPYTDYIQIDAPINQGNSGGPTFDLSGRVVGMNSMIFSPSGGSVGIGFAIPSSTIQEIVAQLKESGSVSRGWLGVEIQNLTPDLAASLGVPDAKGAIVARVFPNSPAQRAGIRQGDVILAVNNEEIDDERDLTRRVGNLHAGDRANFNILRDGQRLSISALIERRDEEQVALASGTAPPGGPPAAAATLGLGLAPLDQAARQQYNIGDNVNGVVVTSVDPGSEAAQKNIRPGSVILAIGNKEVRTPADIQAGIAEAGNAGRDSILLLVTTGQGQGFVALKIGEN